MAESIARSLKWSPQCFGREATPQPICLLKVLGCVCQHRRRGDVFGFYQQIHQQEATKSLSYSTYLPVFQSFVLKPLQDSTPESVGSAAAHRLLAEIDLDGVVRVAHFPRGLSIQKKAGWVLVKKPLRLKRTQGNFGLLFFGLWERLWIFADTYF